MVALSPARLARFRSDAYELLAGAFLYPETSRLERIASAARRRRDRDFLAGLALYEPWTRLVRILRRISPRDAAALQADYMRLFAVDGAGGCPPYESHFSPSGPQHAALVVAEIERGYATEGVSVAPGLGEPADHVAVELEFMGMLCAREAAAWAEGAHETCALVMGREYVFLDRHLGRWFPAFARAAARSAGHPYAAVIETAGAFIHHDRDLVDLMRRNLPVPSISTVIPSGAGADS